MKNYNELDMKGNNIINCPSIDEKIKKGKVINTEATSDGTMTQFMVWEDENGNTFGGINFITGDGIGRQFRFSSYEDFITYIKANGGTGEEVRVKLLDERDISKIKPWVGTKEEFEALDKSTLEDGQEVIITNDYEDSSIIDDTASATDKVYSSDKVDEELDKRIPLLTGTVDILNSSFPKASNYYVSPTVGEGIGLPTNPKSSWYLEHKSHIADYKYPTQIAYEYSGLKRIVYRTCNNGTWSSWQEVQSKKSVIFSGIKTKTIPANTDTNFGATITIDKTSQYLMGFTVLSNVETSADANIYFDIKVYDVTDNKRLACFENTNLGWKHNPVTALFCESNSFVWELTAGHTYDVRMYTNIEISYRCELWAKEV